MSGVFGIETIDVYGGDAFIASEILGLGLSQIGIVLWGQIERGGGNEKEIRYGEGVDAVSSSFSIPSFIFNSILKQVGLKEEVEADV